MDYPIILFALLSHKDTIMLRSSFGVLRHKGSITLRSSFGVPSVTLRSGNGKVSYLPKALSIVATS